MPSPADGLSARSLIIDMSAAHSATILVIIARGVWAGSLGSGYNYDSTSASFTLQEVAGL